MTMAMDMAVVRVCIVLPRFLSESFATAGVETVVVGLFFLSPDGAGYVELGALLPPFESRQPGRTLSSAGIEPMCAEKGEIHSSARGGAGLLKGCLYKRRVYQVRTWGTSSSADTPMAKISMYLFFRAGSITDRAMQKR